MKKLIAFKIFLTSFNLFSSITKEQSIILTSYTYPGSLYWEKVIEMGEDKILYVIINPSSGPGEIRDENYVKQIEKIKKDLEKVQNKFADEKFTSKAPAHILDRERKIEAEYLDKLNKLEENLKAFSK